MTQENSPLLIVSGPTASGKSSFGVSLAEYLNGEVISTDSAQVYKDFDIGTDKIPLPKRKGIPHHCLDVAEPTDQSNVTVWLKCAREARELILQNDKLPIYVGGTTLYISSLVNGLDNLPPANDELRESLELLSTPDIYQKARELKCKISDINPNDRIRLIRAIEISMTPMRASETQWTRKESALMIVLLKDRNLLYQNINLRVEKMINTGLLEEANKLATIYGIDCPAFRTLGYQQISEFGHSNFAASDLKEAISQASRRYAKRQLTFWRNAPSKFGWHSVPQQNTNSKFIHGEKKNILTTRLSNQVLKEMIKERLLMSFDKPEVWYIELED